MRSLLSVITHPTCNFLHVPRRLRTVAISSIVVVTDGLSEDLGDTSFWSSPTRRFNCVDGVSTFSYSALLGHVGLLHFIPASLNRDTHLVQSTESHVDDVQQPIDRPHE